MSPFVRRARVDHTDRVLARSVFAIVLGVYTATFTGLPDNPDGEIQFQTTSSLGRTGGLALSDTPEARRILEVVGDLPPGASPVRRGEGARADRWYAWFGVGQAAAALPLYWAGKLAGLAWSDLERAHQEHGYYGQPASEYFAHLLVGWRNPLLGALTAALVALASRRLEAGRTAAWVAGMTYGLTTYAWPQARSSLSDVQATFLLFLAFHLILRIREGFERLEVVRPGEVLALGVALGLAFLTRVATLPATLVLAAAAEVVLRAGHRRLAASRWTPSGRPDVGGRRATTLILAPLAGALGIFLATNGWRFGDPLDSGYGPALGEGLLGGSPLQGLAGLVLSPGRGLVWMAPLVLLAPLGIRRARAGGDRLYGRLLAGVALTTALPPAFMEGWHGGWTYGPRYLLPALPFLWVGVALALDRGAGTPSRTRRVLAGALGTLGLLVQVPAALVDHMTHQDLAVQAARVAWPDGGPAGSGSPADGGLGPEADPAAAAAEHRRFVRTLWDWGFAAPWAHWRILRHRAAGQGEAFPLGVIFLLDEPGQVSPLQPRDEGFRHLAWVDHALRLGGPIWPGALAVLTLVLGGLAMALRGLMRGPT